ncbi:MAG: UDP-2,4-diacetamido-2,4,6-trideoxy-beta-L-altropyranose hydrolase [Eubacteriales bacterium]
MILFRVDGNTSIGTGHVMRCLSIAQALNALGESCEFITADYFMEPLITEKGFLCHVLQNIQITEPKITNKNIILTPTNSTLQTAPFVSTKYDDLDSEIPSLCNFLSKLSNKNSNKKPLLLIDSYFVTKKYFDTLSDYAQIVYIDDLFQVPGQVDYLINYNCYGHLLDYASQSIARKDYLLGTSFAPLRAEFQNVSYTIQKDCTRIFITTGGADQFNISGQLLMEFSKHPTFSSFEFHVVMGMFHQHKEFVEQLATQYTNIKLHYQVQFMSELMESCDLAVSAAGSTIYELLAIGLPTISFAFVDNQNRIVDTLGKEGTILSTGHYQRDSSLLISRTVDAIINLSKDFSLRKVLHQKGKQALDGKGAARIATALLEWSH